MVTEESVFAQITVLAHGVSYALFITICLRGVDEAVTHIERFARTAFSLLWRHLEESVT